VVNNMVVHSLRPTVALRPSLIPGPTVVPISAPGTSSRPYAPGGAPAPSPLAPVTTLPDPANPLTEILKAPVNASLILADLAQALFHPIKTIKSLWNLFGNLNRFDAMTPLQAAAGPAARDTLHAAVSNLKDSGLTHVLGFAARAIDKRAGVAFDQLRPSVETSAAMIAGHQVYLMWPASGRNWTALDDTIAIQNVIANYPAPVVQKAFAGVSEVQVVDQSVRGYFQPVRRSGAALILSRPLGLVPGEKRIDESLMQYLNEAGKVSANF
jgi:hypothetical protein